MVLYDIVFTISLAFILEYFLNRIYYTGTKNTKREHPQSKDLMYIQLPQTKVNSRNGKQTHSNNTKLPQWNNDKIHTITSLKHFKIKTLINENINDPKHIIIINIIINA
jgi:hypothetical protein